MNVQHLAKMGYNAYGQAADWKNFQGSKMPEWEELPYHIHEKWFAAARTIVKEYNWDKRLRTSREDEWDEWFKVKG